MCERFHELLVYSKSEYVPDRLPRSHAYISYVLESHLLTHGNTDVAQLTFDMSDCRVLVDSFPRDLLPLQVNPYTFSNRMQGCSQPCSQPSRESPSGVASEGISRLSSWKLLHNLASCPDPRTLQNL